VFEAKSHLITVRASDSARDTIFSGDNVWAYVWASDGRIYGWTGSVAHRRRIAVDPPPRWRAEHPEPREAHPVIVKLFHPFGFMPGANASEWSLPVDAAHVYLGNALPGDSLYLVTGEVAGQRRRASSFIDLHGRFVRETGDSLAIWTSVSSDGH